jgi:hypothetical protein
MVEAIIEILAVLVTALTELLYWLRGLIAGWRYLFSPSYRARTHARWKRRSPVYAVVETICAALACAAWLVLLYLLIGLVAART